MNLKLFVFIRYCIVMGVSGIMKGPDGPPGPIWDNELPPLVEKFIIILLIGLALLVPVFHVLTKLGYIWKRQQIAHNSA